MLVQLSLIEKGRQGELTAQPVLLPLFTVAAMVILDLATGWAFSAVYSREAPQLPVGLS